MAGAENQALVQRWVEVSDRQRLAEALGSVGTGGAREVQEKARTWQNRFGQALRMAGQRAAENAKAVKACVPALRSATQAMNEVNADVLGRSERQRFEDARTRLRDEAEEALTREDLWDLRNAVSGMKALVTGVRAEGQGRAVEEGHRDLAHGPGQLRLRGCAPDRPGRNHGGGSQQLPHEVGEREGAA